MFKRPKGPVTGISLPNPVREHPMPILPTEIWLLILEAVIRPAMIIDIEHQPHQIYLAFKTMESGRHGDQSIAQSKMLEASRSLKVVCSLWKKLVDQIITTKPWVLDDHRLWQDQGRQGTHNRRPINTKNCARLNSEFKVAEEELHVEMRYSHPISTLSIAILESHQASLASLEDIISFPSQLRVLSILAECQIGQSFLKSLQMGLSALTTLKLSLYLSQLTEPMEFPAVITFFLDIKQHTIPFNNPPLNTQWKLPMLRSLGLKQNPAFIGSEQHFNLNPLLFELLKTRVDSIRALFIEPLPQEIVDINSPICWLKMKQLNSLATDFRSLSMASSRAYITKDWPKSISVRHLIQTNLGLKQLDIESKLRFLMACCPNLEAIILSVSYCKFYEEVILYSCGIPHLIIIIRHGLHLSRDFEACAGNSM
jgi:hypothetical protein